MADVYKFFQFLNDKEGKQIPLRAKYRYNPEGITGDDLKVEGDLWLGNTKIKTLPAGLQIQGSLQLRGSSIETIPEDIQVGKDWVLTETPSLKALPANLHVKGSLELNKSKLRQLPTGLTVDGNLTLDGTSITEIPEGTKVGGVINMSKMPTKYPLELEDQLAIAGGQSVASIRAFEKNTEPISISIGKRGLKGRGQVVDYNNLSALELKHSFPTMDHVREQIKKYAELLAGPFKIKSWNEVADFRTLGSAYQGNQGVDHKVAVKGVDDRGRTIAIYITINPWSIVPKALSIISAEGEASLKAIMYSLEDISPTKLQQINAKLFTNDEKEKPTAALDLKTIFRTETLPEVSITFGRITRGGNGLKGKYKDLAPSLSKIGQDNLATTGDKLGVAWDDMIIYNREGTILYAATGKSADGKEFMFDKAGIGAGGYSKIYSGKTKVNASDVYSGFKTADDFS